MVPDRPHARGLAVARCSRPPKDHCSPAVGTDVPSWSGHWSEPACPAGRLATIPATTPIPDGRSDVLPGFTGRIDAWNGDRKRALAGGGRRAHRSPVGGRAHLLGLAPAAG